MAEQHNQVRRAEDLTSAELAALLRRRLQLEEEEAAAAAGAVDAAREERKEVGEEEEERDGAGRDLSGDTGQRIYDAAKEGDVAALRPLVQQWRGREDVLNWAAADESTPLLIGSRLGRLEAVRLLLATPGEAPLGLSLSFSLFLFLLFVSSAPPSPNLFPPLILSPIRHRRQPCGQGRTHGRHAGRSTGPRRGRAGSPGRAGNRPEQEGY